MIKLLADMHTHTIASTHAYSTILENSQAAQRKGLELIAMTDHAEKMPDSPYFWHFENMKCLPRVISGVTVVRGVEANIVDDCGNVDMSDDLLKKMEWVVASIHRYCYQSDGEAMNTRAYLKIAENPYVDVIGHCTTAAFPFDYETCLKKFKECGKLVEINESSILNKKGSRENSVEIIKLCKKLDMPVIINSDAHFCELIGETPNALQMVYDLDFPQELVINADAQKLKEHIIKKHNIADIV